MTVLTRVQASLTGAARTIAQLRAQSGLAAYAIMLAQTTAGAVVLALLSQVTIPFKPVPLTLQVLGVLLLGGALGPRLGALAVLEYLVMGACGLPVFAGWSSLPAMLAAPKGLFTLGYLIAFAPATCVYGLLLAKFSAGAYPRRLAGAALAGIAGVAVIYLGGWAWLAVLIGPLPALLGGIVPFLVVDSIKIATAAGLLAVREKGSI